MTKQEAMSEEFDTVARWTSEAVAELGPDHALPAACRGSGSPAALEWLARRTGCHPDTRLLDVGAGLGGPAEYAARSFGVRPVLVEPMLGACRSSLALFGRPVTTASGEALPIRSAAFDVVWCLGVLCTVEDQAAMLAELRRVVTPGGRVGLLVFVRVVDRLPEQPEGNNFPSPDDLERLCAGVGLSIEAQVDLADFPAPDETWTDAVAAVDALIARDHGDDERFDEASRQEAVMARLLDDGLVVGRLCVAVPVTPPARASH
ncbi:C5-O-methyltransferase [metagenome]|uniref:C5-O-methyltransferase n=1 Tax=metagenome TaxID=256318 RepID=A0A2P2C2H9_9ZZZZ